MTPPTVAAFLASHPRQYFFRISLAARCLGCHPNTVRRWLDEGSLHALHTPGGQYQIGRKAIVAFAARYPKKCRR